MTKRKSDNARYEGMRIHKLLLMPGFRPHRLVEYYSPATGKKREVACEYQVEVGGEWITLVRYDSCHGVFHRHRPFYGTNPRRRDVKRDTEFANIPMAKRASTALADVGNNARAWQKLILKEELENGTGA